MWKLYAEDCCMQKIAAKQLSFLVPGTYEPEVTIRVFIFLWL